MPRRAHLLVLAVFAAVALVGGSNPVAIRFSNRELAPFWGAAIRLAASSLLLFGLVALTRAPLPRGKALAGALVYGLLNFGAFYALLYWGLVAAPAALGAAFPAATPLLTLLIAAGLGMERLTWRGVGGGVVALVGVVVIFADQLSADVPLAALAALAALPLTLAVVTVVLKRLPRAHPFATNAVATIPGAAALLALSLFAGERIALPERRETWIALLYLVPSTAVLLAGFLFVVRRWTASASSYATVLLPVSTVALGALLAGEFVSLAFVAGAGLVMVGTYFGGVAKG